MPRGVGHGRVMRRLVHTGGLLFFGFWTGLPFYWIIVTAIKPNLLIYREPSLFPSQLTAEHFAFVRDETHRLHRLHATKMLRNVRDY